MEKSEAQAEVWKYVYGFSELRMVKCAVELGLPDAVGSHGGRMSLPELSSAVGCPETTLSRVMRFLNHRGIFKKQVSEGGDVYYAETPLSRLLTRGNMGPLVLAQDGPDSCLSAQDLRAGKGSGLEVGSPDDELWSPEFGGEEFRGMVRDYFYCHGRVTTSSLIEGCPEIFRGIPLLVDVGGRDGTSLGMLVAAFPGMRGINFDLPHVVSGAPTLDRVDHVGGDMFKAIPKANAVMLMVPSN